MKDDNKGFKMAIGVIVLLAGIGYFIGVGIYGLVSPYKNINGAFTSPKKYVKYEGYVSDVSKCYCELKHLLNYIPSGKTYYYLIASEDGKSVMTVRAKKGWSPSSTENKGYKISGELKKIPSEVKDALHKNIEDNEEITKEFVINDEYYIDTQNNKMSVIYLIAGVSFSIAFLSVFILLKKPIDEKTLSKKIWGWVLLCVILVGAWAFVYIYVRR